MRISPISAHLSTNQKNYLKNVEKPTEVCQPSFKQKGLATTGGGLFGLCVAILSGQFWAVPVFGGLGYLGDKMSEKSETSITDNYKLPGYEDISGLEWVG